jgi:hypothetical protein
MSLLGLDEEELVLGLQMSGDLGEIDQDLLSGNRDSVFVITSIADSGMCVCIGVYVCVRERERARVILFV